MRITQLNETQPRERRVAVGEFDGVHRGHREVIRGANTVLTFEPHPLAVVHPEAAPKLLTRLDVKAELVGSLGVEELVIIEFDREFAAREASVFIDEVLVGTLGATWVSVGENFRFGYRASGDIHLLRAQDAFETRVAPLVEHDDEIVSSTHIRGLVVAGEVDVAAGFLGSPFRMRGPVVHGDKLGRDLGFPTANLVPDDALVCPGHGVYACIAHPAGGGTVPAAVNVGVRPTFVTGRGVLVEAYLIDYEGDLYDTELTLEFLARLRGEKRFGDVDALVTQMHADVGAAREITARA